MQAYLILANGRVFRGVSVGCPGTTIGEVSSPPAWSALRRPLPTPATTARSSPRPTLIGNYGMNSQDVESGKIWAKGYIVREDMQDTLQLPQRKNAGYFLKRKRHHRH